MKQGLLAACTTIISVLALIPPTTFAVDGWKDLELEGDQLFAAGQFAQAAEKYNLSSELALQAGEDLAASAILAKLGRCFAQERLNNADLFVRYIMQASDLTFALGQRKDNLTERAKLYLDSASYAAEAGLGSRARALINLSAFAYLEAAEGLDFARGSGYIRRAAYLFHFNNLSEHDAHALDPYRNLLLEEIARSTSEARQMYLMGLWEEAGRRFYEAALRSYEIQGPATSDLFGMAAEALSKAAWSMEMDERTGPANLSRRAHLYRLAAISAEFNSTESAELFQRAGEDFFQAATKLLESKNLSDAISNFTQAAIMYEKSGIAELSKGMYVQAARTAQELASSGPLRSYNLQLEAGMAYDSAGLYREAAQAYYNSLQDFGKSIGLTSYMWPWQQFELLQILGRGRRFADARTFSAYTLKPIAFFAAPTLGAYDIVGQLGPAIAYDARTRFAYDPFITETLLVAASALLNGQPFIARSLTEECSGMLALNPPLKALYDFILAVIDAQQEGRAAWDRRVALTYDALRLVYLDDLAYAFATSLADSLSGVLAGELTSQLFIQHCRRVVSVALEDLRQAAEYNRSIDDCLSEAQRLSTEMAGSKVRDPGEHLRALALWQTVARRWSFQGKLNESGFYYEQACYHACAGEDFQKSILCHDLSWGCLGFRTPMTAAAYAIASAMLDANQTLKAQAKSFILGNLSGYIPSHQVSVLLSVLEERTQLQAGAALLKAVAMGLIGGFVLLTSYVLLIWEQKRPRKPSAPSQEPPHEDEETGRQVGEEASCDADPLSGAGESSGEPKNGESS